MNRRFLLATSRRVLDQLRHDPRSIAMTLVLPSALLTLLSFLFEKSPGAFDRIGLVMLAVFPFAMMFLVTSIAMLRERTSGTLERLLTTPINKADLLFGYGLAYTLVAAAQALITAFYAVALLDLSTRGNFLVIVVVAMVNAFAGVALGLLGSAFARTEFQVMQLMPVVIVPQIFVCGLMVPRDRMASWLQAFSDVMPMTYAVDAMMDVGTHPNITGTLLIDLGIVLVVGIAALGLAAMTLPRRSD